MESTTEKRIKHAALERSRHHQTRKLIKTLAGRIPKVDGPSNPTQCQILQQVKDYCLFLIDEYNRIASNYDLSPYPSSQSTVGSQELKLVIDETPRDEKKSQEVAQEPPEVKSEIVDNLLTNDLPTTSTSSDLNFGFYEKPFDLFGNFSFSPLQVTPTTVISNHRQSPSPSLIVNQLPVESQPYASSYNPDFYKYPYYNSGHCAGCRCSTNSINNINSNQSPVDREDTYYPRDRWWNEAVRERWTQGVDLFNGLDRF